MLKKQSVKWEQIPHRIINRTLRHGNTGPNNLQKLREILGSSIDHDKIPPSLISSVKNVQPPFPANK